MNRRLAMVWIATFLAACAVPEGPPVRPATWAAPLPSTELENFHRVAPDLYRCAQPSAAGMRELASTGVRSVVNLRYMHSDRDEVAGTGLALVELPDHAFAFGYRDLCEALRAVLQAPKPVVVHCQHGADRTGALCAAWRVAVDGWTPQQALDEMCGGGFGHSRWFPNLRALVLGLDRARLRADVGLPSVP
ncbi:MAG: tyrosine-protein phosphatase [Planctomycetes bacterium]|nr:tyrosine-protein phosphatase [Planctomycetota bacterium]